MPKAGETWRSMRTISPGFLKENVAIARPWRATWQCAPSRRAARSAASWKTISASRLPPSSRSSMRSPPSCAASGTLMAHAEAPLVTIVACCNAPSGALPRLIQPALRLVRPVERPRNEALAFALEIERIVGWRAAEPITFCTTRMIKKFPDQQAAACCQEQCKPTARPRGRAPQSPDSPVGHDRKSHASGNRE